MASGRSVIVPAALLAWLSLTSVASAELVFFTSGRAFSIKGHRVEGDSIVLLLRGGGEVVWIRTLLERPPGLLQLTSGLRFENLRNVPKLFRLGL